MKNLSGKLIVVEGIDGSGKSTQVKLLVRHLKKEGFRVAKIHFPQYGSKSAGLLEKYLNGEYGSPEEVGPWRASIFYACDRYDGSFKMKRWLKEGKIVIADRYIASNLAHQGEKIKNKKERKKFLKWLFDLEYNIFEIPKASLTFILKTPPSLARKMALRISDKEKREKKVLYSGKKKRDIHEEDIRHLEKTFEAYMELGKIFPKEFKIIECLENGKLLPPKTIHQKIWQELKKILP